MRDTAGENDDEEDSKVKMEGKESDVVPMEDSDGDETRSKMDENLQAGPAERNEKETRGDDAVQNKDDNHDSTSTGEEEKSDVNTIDEEMYEEDGVQPISSDNPVSSDRHAFVQIHIKSPSYNEWYSSIEKGNSQYIEFVTLIIRRRKWGGSKDSKPEHLPYQSFFRLHGTTVDVLRNGNCAVDALGLGIVSLNLGTSVPLVDDPTNLRRILYDHAKSYRERFQALQCYPPPGKDPIKEWKDDVLDALYTPGHDYTYGALSKQWLDCPYACPIFADLFQTTVVVYQVDKGTGTTTMYIPSPGPTTRHSRHSVTSTHKESLEPPPPGSIAMILYCSHFFWLVPHTQDDLPSANINMPRSNDKSREAATVNDDDGFGRIGDFSDTDESESEEEQRAAIKDAFPSANINMPRSNDKSREAATVNDDDDDDGFGHIGDFSDTDESESEEEQRAAIKDAFPSANINMPRSNDKSREAATVNDDDDDDGFGHIGDFSDTDESESEEEQRAAIKENVKENVYQVEFRRVDLGLSFEREGSRFRVTSIADDSKASKKVKVGDILITIHSPGTKIFEHIPATALKSVKDLYSYLSVMRRPLHLCFLPAGNKPLLSRAARIAKAASSNKNEAMAVDDDDDSSDDDEDASPSSRGKSTINSPFSSTMSPLDTAAAIARIGGGTPSSIASSFGSHLSPVPFPGQDPCETSLSFDQSFYESNDGQEDGFGPELCNPLSVERHYLDPFFKNPRALDEVVVNPYYTEVPPIDFDWLDKAQVHEFYQPRRPKTQFGERHFPPALVLDLVDPDSDDATEANRRAAMCLFRSMSPKSQTEFISYLRNNVFKRPTVDNLPLPGSRYAQVVAERGDGSDRSERLAVVASAADEEAQLEKLVQESYSAAHMNKRKDRKISEPIQTNAQVLDKTTRRQIVRHETASLKLLQATAVDPQAKIKANFESVTIYKTNAQEPNNRGGRHITGVGKDCDRRHGNHFIVTCRSRETAESILGKSRLKNFKRGSNSLTFNTLDGSPIFKKQQARRKRPRRKGASTAKRNARKVCARLEEVDDDDDDRSRPYGSRKLCYHEESERCK